MAAWQLAVIAAACLFAVGDRVALSWERSYYRSLAWSNQAQFEKARAAAESGYRVWRARPQSRPYWLFRIALAESLIELDRIDDALPLLTSSAPAPQEARRLSDLAMVQFRSGQYDPAWQSIAAAGRVAPSAPDVRARVDLVRSMLQVKRDDPADAEASLRQALADVAGSNSLIEAYTLSDLGYLALHRSRYDEALYWFTRAQALARRNGLRRPLEMATGNLGAAYRNLGDFERAAQNLSSAAALAQELHDQFYQVPWLVLLGETWDESGDLTKAAESFQKARALATPGRGREWLSNALDDLSHIALQKGDLESAAELNAQGIALAEQSRSSGALLAHRVQSGAIALARKQYPLAEQIYRETLAASDRAEDPLDAFECHAALSALYRQTGSAAKAAAEFRAASSVIDRFHSGLQQDESKFSFLSSLIDFYRAYVDFLFDGGNAGGAFRVAESSRAQVLEERLHRRDANAPAADLKALEEEVRVSGTILLSYWLAPRRSLLWVIDSHGLRGVELPPEAEIADRVRRYNDAIQRGDDPAAIGNEAGRWLFEKLVTPAHAAAGSNVVIEADGILHQLNFETLPTGNGRYWISDATISVAPSLALLRRSAFSPAGRLLAFGDPGYDGTEYQSLANAKRELQAVARHFPEKEVYVSSAATPAAFRAARPESYSTLHFAAHAVANRESPLDSAIILAGPPDSRKLYAREILDRPLTAQLVTLSACQTAGSRTYYGEGLTGFSWAFLSAGARNVIAGLWDVDDGATARLMTDLYDGLASGLAPVNALRRAKLNLIASGGAYRRPRYWAPFETFTRAIY
jgi:CHAT domain-containing protein